MATGSHPEPVPRLGMEPLTYGVELEFVFAFHEDELQPFLKTRNGVKDEIIKDVPLAEREWQQGFSGDEDRRCTRIPSYELPNRPYNSWCLKKAGYPPNDACFPYLNEPQEILAKKIKNSWHTLPHDGGGEPKTDYPRVCKAMLPSQKLAGQYERWTVTADHSVCGVGSANIEQWLPNRVEPGSEADWDSYGLELISPVYSTDKDDHKYTRNRKEEIEKMLEIVNGNDSEKTGAFITNQTGLHVHIKAPEDLTVMKELAILVLVYEEEIARLNPPCRRPGHPVANNNIESNRLGFILEEKYHTHWNNYGHIDTSTEAIKRIPKTIKDIREWVGKMESFREISMGLNWPHTGKNGEEWGNRNRQVNFTAAARPPDIYAQTVEFRSARGSLCAEDVNRWTDFCIGLVRLADFYVANPTRFPVSRWDDFLLSNGSVFRNNVDVFDLLRDMGTDDAGIEYWERRAAKWMFGRNGDADDRSDNEVHPPGYVQPHDRSNPSTPKLQRSRSPSGSSDNGSDTSTPKLQGSRSPPGSPYDGSNTSTPKIQGSRSPPGSPSSPADPRRSFWGSRDEGAEASSKTHQDGDGIKDGPVLKILKADLQGISKDIDLKLLGKTYTGDADTKKGPVKSLGFQSLQDVFGDAKTGDFNKKKGPVKFTRGFQGLRDIFGDLELQLLEKNSKKRRLQALQSLKLGDNDGPDTKKQKSGDAVNSNEGPVTFDREFQGLHDVIGGQLGNNYRPENEKRKSGGGLNSNEGPVPFAGGLNMFGTTRSTVPGGIFDPKNRVKTEPPIISNTGNSPRTISPKTLTKENPKNPDPKTPDRPIPKPTTPNAPTRSDFFQKAPNLQTIAAPGGPSPSTPPTKPLNPKTPERPIPMPTTPNAPKRSDFYQKMMNVQTVAAPDGPSPSTPPWFNPSQAETGSSSQELEGKFSPALNHPSQTAKRPSSSQTLAATMGTTLTLTPSIPDPSATSDTPASNLSPDEEMTHDGVSWKVRDFNFTDWTVIPVDRRIEISTTSGPQSHQLVCNVNALLQSMLAQYPDEPLGHSTSPAQLLALLDDTFPPSKTGYTEEQVDKLLDIWTGGAYILVAVDGIRVAARRVGDVVTRQQRVGRNLYVCFSWDQSKSGGSRRYGGMKRGAS